MNRKDFYKLYEEWLRNVIMDELWFIHRLNELTDNKENDLSIRRSLVNIGASAHKARIEAERLVAEEFPRLRINSPVSDEPLPVFVAELPARLRELRKSNGWRLIDISLMTGLSPSFLSDIERGRVSPSFETLQKLAGVYCVPITFQVAPVVGEPKGGKWIEHN